MNLIKSVYNFTILSIRLMIMKVSVPKTSIILSFFRLHLKYQLSKIFPNIDKEITVGRCRIEFFNFEVFLYLYSEIFMQQLYFFKNEKNNPIIIDCGSNVGLSIIYFKYLYPNAKIIGFEPNRNTFDLLKRNIENNNLKNVQIFNFAIADYDGFINFYDDQSIEGSLVSGVHSSRTAVAKTEVACITLNHYLDQQIDFLKMDIEGAEGICFKDIDLSRKIKNINKMILECHHNIQSSKNLVQVLNILEKNNFHYQISSIEKPPFLKVSPQDVMIYITNDSAN